MELMLRLLIRLGLLRYAFCPACWSIASKAYSRKCASASGYNWADANSRTLRCVAVVVVVVIVIVVVVIRGVVVVITMIIVE